MPEQLPSAKSTHKKWSIPSSGRSWFAVFVAGCFILLSCGSGKGAGYGGYESTPESPWKQFEKIFGKSIHSKEVKQFIAQYGLVQKTGYDFGATDFGVFETKPELAPVAFTYRNGKVWKVSVIVGEEPGLHVKPYRDDIPLGLSRSDTPKEAIAKFGAPSASSGPKWLKYPQIGIELMFRDSNDQLFVIGIIEKTTAVAK